MSEQPKNTGSRSFTARIPDAQLKPWLPPELDVEDMGAIRAVWNGTAAAHQQRKALECIVKKLCGTDHSAFVPGGEEGRRATDYALGKADIARLITSIINTNPHAGGEQG